MILRDFYNRFSLDESLAEVTGHNPYYRRIDSGLNKKILVNGHEMIDLASNNYLGLATDDRVKQAAMKLSKSTEYLCAALPSPQGALICTKSWKENYLVLSGWRIQSSSLRKLLERDS
ncbi:MAG: hypothetical protein P4L69_05670 [Desulfosporosinus sp.]|nr:hypothetical protein [Desulfosporosinus sp.]